jgi:predicted transcriptional regulator YdeE
MRIRLAPGDVIAPWAFGFSKAIEDILGDSLPEGRYYAAGAMALEYWSGDETPDDTWPDTHVWLPVGEVTLRHRVAPR